MSKERFIVKDVVCDYGVFDTEFPDEDFICVCKARANALLVADILNTDYQKPNECVYWKDQQLAELKAENERLANLNNQYATQLEQEHNKQPNLQNLCNNFQQQLKEKDEIIKNLERRDKANTNADKVLVAYITKQVCEKIRKMAYDKFDFDICEECGEWVHNSNVITYIDFNKILDQIERGENNVKD